MAVVFVLLLILPFVELAAFVAVTGAIGFGWSLALIVVLAVAGLWLMKREGLGVWRRGTARLQAGEMPTAEVVNGIILLVAGMLFVFPGFVTDAVAVALLLPPVRSVVRMLLFRRFERRLQAAAGSPVATIFTTPQGRISTGPATYGQPVDVREVTGPPSAGSSPPGRS
jgi:UPF0716 protein FxsA